MRYDRNMPTLLSMEIAPVKSEAVRARGTVCTNVSELRKGEKRRATDLVLSVLFMRFFKALKALSQNSTLQVEARPDWGEKKGFRCPLDITENDRKQAPAA
jgi:hypothetical protein